MIPTHLFLHQHLRHSAELHPGHVAVIDGNRSLTYAALHDTAHEIAGRLAGAGVVPGSRVILLMANSADFVRTFWGAVYAGAVVTPLNPDTALEKLAWIIADCSPSAIIADQNRLDEIAVALPQGCEPALLSPTHLPDPASSYFGRPAPCDGRQIDQDLGCLIYTSGSTGKPKGVMLSHQNLTAASRSVCTYLGYRHDDRLFVAVPLSFDYGMHQLTMAALVGATVIVEKSFGNPLFALDRLRKSAATVFPIVPTMVALMSPLADRFDLGCVRLVTSTAAALHVGKIDRLAEIFPKATIYSMYGLTECHRCTYLPPDQLARRKDSVGIAIPNTELWVESQDGTRHTRSATGELVIRGATVMKGYWNNPEKTAQRLKPGRYPGEHVLYTGDLCRVDSEGFLYFLARSDDVMKVRGEKVAPKEVEDAILTYPAVSEALVYGKPDEIHGQIVCAVVAPKPGMEINPAELKAWCATRLEPLAVPQRIDVRQTLARNSNGKIDRAALLVELV